MWLDPSTTLFSNLFHLCYSKNGNRISGGNAGGATPVPIPNTEVKPTRADDTWIARSWESRTLPDLSYKNPRGLPGGFYFCPGLKHQVPSRDEDNKVILECKC